MTVFESATAYPMIFVAQKGKPSGVMPLFTEPKSLDAPYPDVRAIAYEVGQPLPLTAFQGADWNLTSIDNSVRIEKMRSSAMTLGAYINGKIYYGIKTGFNTAFVIDDNERAKLIAEDRKSIEIIKPLALGRDVKKWRIQAKGKWLITTKIGTKMSRYPAIMAHLNKFETQLTARSDQGDHWWELRTCAYYDIFDKPKICYQEIATFQSFAFDNDGFYVNNKIFVIPTADLYLLGLLNSAIVWEYLHAVCPKLQGGALAMQSPYLLSIPIPNTSENERTAIIDVVQKCLNRKGVDVSELEAEINGRVAALYGL